MKSVVVVLALGALVSCASAPHSYVMPDGRTAQVTYCDGPKNALASCYNFASAKCGGPYEVVDRISDGYKREVAFICTKS
jgi:hypothetical protein